MQLRRNQKTKSMYTIKTIETPQGEITLVYKLAADGKTYLSGPFASSGNVPWAWWNILPGLAQQLYGPTGLPKGS